LAGDVRYKSHHVKRQELTKMLRITVQEEVGYQTIKLEGKVVGPWVNELRRSWQSLAPSLGTRELLLDLRGVSFVDAEGRKLLRDIYQKNGAHFLADSPLTNYFVDLAMQCSSTSENKGA